MGREQRETQSQRLSVLDSVRGHDSTVAHSWNHTEGRCPKCGCPQQAMMFCLPDSELPRVRGCELDGEHVHRVCQSCRYPWIERPLDQAMLSEAQGDLPAESELAALLAAIADRAGGLSLDRVLVSTYRGWIIHFVRDPERGTITVTASPPPPQAGKPVHPELPPAAE